MILFRNDDVVNHINVNNLAHFYNTVGNQPVCIRGFHFAAGVVMHHYQSNSQFVNGHSKYIGRISSNTVLPAKTNEFNKKYFTSSVKAYYPKMFLAAAQFIFTL